MVAMTGCRMMITGILSTVMQKLLSLILFAVCMPLRAVELPGPLVDAEWLVNHRDEVLVLDVRKYTKTFAKGHIPGAILVDVNLIRIERKINDKDMTRMRPDAATFEQFMRDHGIDNDSLVVLTHRGEKAGHVNGAARLYWHMKYFGFDRVALLDGGNPSWVEALEDLVTGIDPVRPGKLSRFCRATGDRRHHGTGAAGAGKRGGYADRYA